MENLTAMENKTPKTQITVSTLLTDLEEGLTRKEISKKHDIPYTILLKMFKHPALIGKRKKKIVESAFELIDDTVITAKTVEDIEGKAVKGLDEIDQPKKSFETQDLSEYDKTAEAGVTEEDFEEDLFQQD